MMQKYIDMCALLYGSSYVDAVFILLPPLVSIALKNYSSDMYNVDSIGLNDAVYYIAIFVSLTVLDMGLDNIVLSRMQSKRKKFLERDTKLLTILCGHQISRQNNIRIDRALNNIPNALCLFWLPIDIYKTVVNIMMGLYLLPNTVTRIYATCIFVALWIITYIISQIYEKIKKRDYVNYTKPIFDKYSKDGYVEIEKKFETSSDILSLDNSNLVNTLLSHGKSIKEDSYIHTLNIEFYSRLKWFIRNIVSNIASGIIYIIILNNVSRGIAMTMRSICMVVQMSSDSLNMCEDIYLVEELMHIRKKLEQAKHICATQLNRMKCRTFSDINTLELINVTFHHDIDILTEKSDKYSSKILGISDLSFVFEKGLYYITGVNGAGKSSLFKSITGNSDGMILINGIDRVYYNFLELRQLIFHLNQMNDGPTIVKENMLTKLKSEYPNLANKLELDSLEGIGCDQKAGSGGQEQRIHLFLALSSKSKILLLDEPFSALDVRMKNIVEDLLIEESKNRIILVVSHGSFSEKTGVKKLTLLSHKETFDGNTKLV